jgi:hypothetical protein
MKDRKLQNGLDETRQALQDAYFDALAGAIE